MANVLVVDDCADQALLIAGLLEADGHDVGTVHDGGQALEAIQSSPPDIVVTDLIMPGLNGLELVEAIRRNHATLPIILTTAFGNGEIAMKALQRGAASYVPKRRIKEDLVDIVEQILELSQARRQRIRMLAAVESSELGFILPNDTSLVAPLVDYIQEMVVAFRPHLNETEQMQVGFALQEALVNAIHHGNLGLDSALRESSTDAYQQEVRRRQADPAYRDRSVELTLRVSPTEITLVVLDQGEGFDLAKVPDPADPENLLRSSGRGLYLIGTFMDQVSHNAAGNEITMIKRLDVPSSAAK